MKPIRMSDHARRRCAFRGTTPGEVVEAVRRGAREGAKKGRLLCRLNFPYNRNWRGRRYRVKQVAPVIVESMREIVVITVYTFFF